MVFDIGLLARPKRAAIPTGDIKLENGDTLRWDKDKTRQFAMLRAELNQGGDVGVWVTRRKGDLLVIVSMDNTQRWGELLHVSVSRPKQNPSWSEIVMIKQAFYGPDRDVMMVLPRNADWVNLHEHCFHMHEAPEAWNMQ